MTPGHAEQAKGLSTGKIDDQANVAMPFSRQFWSTTMDAW
tara:strand:- start:271 stop:390 length:120 start_codon:yes stop_codon:yes gene_type:complete